VLEDLVVDLRRLQLAAQFRRHLGHHALEPLGDPPVRGDLLVCLPEADLDPERVEVIEQALGLVLLDVQPGELQQPPRVVPGVHDLRGDVDVLAVGLGVDLQLGDVEAEGVQPSDAGVELVAVLTRDDERSGDLVPQRVVARAQADAGDDRVDAFVQPTAGLQVHELAGDVRRRGLQVVDALPGRQGRVQLAGLGVDEVRGERPRVAPEERVRQGAVVPGEAGQVQLDEEHGEGVQQAARGALAQAGREEGAVGERELQVPGDQRCGERLAVRVDAVQDDADRLDRRQAPALQVEQELVLALGEGLLDLLDRVHGAAEPDEAHDVPRDASRQRDDEVVGPLLQRHVPGQERELRLVEAPGQSHARSLSRTRTARLVLRRVAGRRVGVG
jgi:hypothetical protein